MKSKAPKKTPAQSTEPNSPSHEEIALRAYWIWLERGGGHGQHESDWFRAEEELRGAASK